MTPYREKKLQRYWIKLFGKEVNLEQIRMDNGPEFTGKIFTTWCSEMGIEMKYIQPGKPMQNAYIERLNRTYREDLLNAYLFETREEVRILSDEWQHKYNNLQPDDASKGQTTVMRNESLLVFPLKRT